MAEIRHEVGIGAPPAEVYRSLATTDGLAGWWTRSVEGDADKGGTLRFYFGQPEPAATMEVVDARPDECVEWRCVGGPDEWVGTTFSFQLKPKRDGTLVLFTNAGWREPVDFIHHCSTRWAYFLISLKHGLEKGEATPWPDDERTDDWG
jgi:uncharacterized protein YndB with AHSA1/START domain